MALSAFEDKTHRPRPSDIKLALGKAAGLWDQLISSIGEHYSPITELWHFGSKYGWALRLKRRERIVLYMTPQHGHFLVGVVLGERAVQTAQKQGLAAEVLAIVDSAPRYAEGRGVRLTVGTKRNARAVEDLVAAKMAF
jgi:hypothetical protein